ncbi:MAG: methyltransferase domain-containing protein [Clostridia bacterium]|nr:methyltransferase domain-containing protein [Clostridia bacterium]
MLSPFCCPVCGGALTDTDRALGCARGHSFDKARSGYVNLLRSQQSHTKRHGDDKRMLVARREFLNRGFYADVRDNLLDAVRKSAPSNGLLLDSGCGEGYYTAHLAEQLPSMTVCGVDISKDALQMAAARFKGMPLAVASVFSLPLADRRADAVISVFAPIAEQEWARVLKPGGTLIRVLPTERHLLGLKEAIYPTARLNKPERTELDGFALTDRREWQRTLTLDTPDDIRHLFEMTPYYYKTGQADQERLLSRESLATEIGFVILTYTKTT